MKTVKTAIATITAARSRGSHTGEPRIISRTAKTFRPVFELFFG